MENDKNTQELNNNEKEKINNNEKENVNLSKEETVLQKEEQMIDVNNKEQDSDQKVDDCNKDIRRNKSKKKKFLLLRLYESLSSNMILTIALTPISLVYNFFYIVGNLDITVREVYRIAIINNIISVILSFITGKFYICFSVTCGSICFLAFNFFVSDSIEHVDALKETVLFFRRLSISDLNMYIKNNFSFVKQKRSYKRSIDLDKYVVDDTEEDDDIENIDNVIDIENTQYETVTNSTVEDIDDEELDKLKHKESTTSANINTVDNNNEIGVKNVMDTQQKIVDRNQSLNAKPIPPQPPLPPQGVPITPIRPNIPNPSLGSSINTGMNIPQPPRPPQPLQSQPMNNSMPSNRLQGQMMPQQSVNVQKNISKSVVNNSNVSNVGNSTNYSGNCINNSKVNEDFSDLDLF